MRNETVVAVLWTLVGVALVCYFAALVSVSINETQWSHVEAPPSHTAPLIYGGH
jgi:hypothetical protein